MHLLAVVLAALGVCGATTVVLGGMVVARIRSPATAAESPSVPAELPVALPSATEPEDTTRLVPPLTDAQRTRGFHECNPPDPGDLGPYAPYRRIAMGRILVPQQGGHTADLGFDVVVHFHGFDPARKFVVPAARGIAFAGIERGDGSGRYASAFTLPTAFQELRDSIERALKEHAGDDRAHIRHLGLSAWSAGFGAVNEILKRHPDQVDAVVILDGMHGSWKTNSARRRRGAPPPRALGDVTLANVTPTVRYAELAARGADEKVFVLTASQVDPVTYPPTALTAQALLSALGRELTPDAPTTEPFARLGAISAEGFTLWAFQGRDEAAHCVHLQFLVPIVTGVLEVTWQTPAMNRAVKPTPLPPSAVAQPRRRRRRR